MLTVAYKYILHNGNINNANDNFICSLLSLFFPSIIEATAVKREGGEEQEAYVI